MKDQPRIDAILPVQAPQGARLDCVVAGGGLAGVRRVRFSGAGLRAERVWMAVPGFARFVLHVAPDAPPGPREAAADDGPWSGVLFLVLPASGYGHGRGIGSHLI
jgi:hypothetical protein